MHLLPEHVMPTTNLRTCRTTLIEGEFPDNCSVSYLSLAIVALEESVGGA